MKFLLFFYFFFFNLLFSQESFVNGFDDIPIYKNMQNDKDSLILFDTINGRYLSSEIVGKEKMEDVRKFYLEVLPNLGWRMENENIFLRDSEKLEINYFKEENDTRIIFSISPKK